jgi:hypothetical protein
VKPIKSLDKVHNLNVKSGNRYANEIEDESDNNDDSCGTQIASDTRSWRTISGTFLNIEILVNSMLWDDVCAGGLSKYAHLADGCMDLVLVSPVPRSELKRFLKRHTNRKNQVRIFIQY